MKIVSQSIELLTITPNAEQLIELAGRTCYKSEDKITDTSAATFIAMIIKRGHHSVIEHASATFRIICDRGVSHEIVRHRLASYSQESTRYCDYGCGHVIFIEPPSLDVSKRTEWLAAMAVSEKHYKSLRQNGVQPQIARSVLPNSLKTEIVMTANFREWRHFITLRCAKAAHPQMRQVADMIRVKLIEKAPNIFGDLGSIG